MPFPDDCSGVCCSEVCYFDVCGVCDDIPENDCVQDCAGTWGGSAIIDECGICNGDGSSCDSTLLVPSEYSTIQSAIDAAVEGDSVLVSAGTYYENITWAATNGIKLIGSGEDDCFIDGNQQETVIALDSGGNIDSTTVITRFTIQNGNGEYGGGIRIGEANPSISHIIIQNNSANDGGGIYIFGGSLPILTNIEIRENHAYSMGGGCISMISVILP